MTKKRSKTPISKFTPQPLDEDLFFNLFDILHDGCFSGNWSATSRVLGLHPRTTREWSKKPPKGPWWNHILQAAIMEVYRSMANSTHKKTRKRAAVVRGMLHKAELHQLKDYMEYNEANNSTVRLELLVHINEAPGQELSTRDLRKAAYMGAYNQNSVREAAKQLCLIRETRGFGDDKQTFYRMPTSLDLEEEH